jgi:hypothetical protein
MNILNLINQDLDNYYYKKTKVLQCSGWHCADLATPSRGSKRGLRANSKNYSSVAHAFAVATQLGAILYHIYLSVFLLYTPVVPRKNAIVGVGNRDTITNAVGKIIKMPR